MKKLMKQFVLIMVLFILTGCAFGTKIKPDHLSKIRTGQTTKAEMIKMLGNPQARETISSGKDVFTWRYESMTPGLFSDTFSAQALHVLFDEQGRVEKYKQTDNTREVNIFTIDSPDIAKPSGHGFDADLARPPIPAQSE